MVEIKQVTQDVAVSGQIHIQDLAEIKAAGFCTMICNRPDGESPDQPTFSAIQAEAEKYGIKAVYLPIVSGQLNDENVQSFKTLISELKSPTLAYCRSGTRSITLWALANAGLHSAAEILETARNVGYDLSGLVGHR